jgi:hypothetical protein
LLWHEPESFREQVSSFLSFSPPLPLVALAHAAASLVVPNVLHVVGVPHDKNTSCDGVDFKPYRASATTELSVMRPQLAWYLRPWGLIFLGDCRESRTSTIMNNIAMEYILQEN